MRIQILESVESINKRLLDYYGLFENQPKFRVVWSSDQYERKKIYETSEGFVLLSPMIQTCPKYMYARDKYILEKITPVPEALIDDVGAKLSYEPLWVFEDNKGNALPPKWEAIVVIFKSITEMMERKDPYKQDEKDGNTIEAMEDRARILEEQLYGNETSIGDALSVGSAVGYGIHRGKHTQFNHNSLRGKF